jgi:hypothetical protein
VYSRRSPRAAISRLALLLIAVTQFVRGAADLVLGPAHQDFAVTATRAVNSVLFIVVVLELVRTIVSRLGRA